MKKGKKKLVIVLVAVVVVVAVGAYTASRTVLGGGATTNIVETLEIKPTDLTNTVNVNGVVESEETEKVYSTFSYPVKILNVEVGDQVTEGDVLCELDTESLLASIEQKKATVYKAQSSASQQVKDAQRKLETAKEDITNNMDSSLQAAADAVRKAEESANLAEINLQKARLDRSNSLTTAEDNGVDLTTDEESILNKTVQVAYASLDNAIADLESANAKYEIAKNASANTLQNYQESVNSAKIASNYSDQYLSIEQLENDLEKTKIKAPVSGTITAVYAVEGAPGSGLLFVIEDINKLVITTKIKEYDIDNIKTGNPVVIKADALTGIEYEGEISTIAPTSIKGTTGDSTTATTVEFVTKVKVNSIDTSLKVGMNTRLDVVIEEKKQVFAVPFEAMGTNDQGESIVFVATKKEDGSAIAKAVVVKTGMETDFYNEISSDQLKEGDMIITQAQGIVDGMPITLATAASAQFTTAGAAQQNGGGGGRMVIRG